MDLSVQNSGEGRYRPVLSDDIPHAVRELGDPGIDHAAEGCRALNYDHRPAFLHGALHLFGEHDVALPAAPELHFAPFSFIRRIRRYGLLMDC